jgi:hypothetical protein
MSPAALLGLLGSVGSSAPEAGDPLAAALAAAGGMLAASQGSAAAGGDSFAAMVHEALVASGEGASDSEMGAVAQDSAGEAGA